MCVCVCVYLSVCVCVEGGAVDSLSSPKPLIWNPEIMGESTLLAKEGGGAQSQDTPGFLPRPSWSVNTSPGPREAHNGKMTVSQWKRLPFHPSPTMFRYTPNTAQLGLRRTPRRRQSLLETMEQHRQEDPD